MVVILVMHHLNLTFLNKKQTSFLNEIKATGAELTVLQNNGHCNVTIRERVINVRK